jgi:hypothetical protein
MQVEIIADIPSDNSPAIACELSDEKITKIKTRLVL